MNTSDTPENTQAPALAGAAPGKTLSPAAQRALEEAARRRQEIDARAAEIAKEKEHQGRGGLEPVRYDDWEVKGLASDF
ncbi:DUF1674 domain-containing protein [Microvirga sp. KLBC 81]|uniref:DUF1674 domain-containing protein n=1 Tax=Microvirga sp. KLBC 81 TaxID=1862707 RepID=UPI000D522FD6|nr:DUF1674 domain-containing protein [Microvirga sp. KLBC 81]PVE24526.1 DUF1674 domain-containing protein [Microvirga sp. KLBC 81]